MDESLKIQMDIKNNAEDLRSYVVDLRNWEDEMKEKEKKMQSEPTSDVPTDIPPPRNKIKRSKSEQEKLNSPPVEGEKPPKRISAYDYSAWDKFDVDKACEEVGKGEDKKESNVDEKDEEESEEEPEKDLKLIDQAFYEKELGNQFVKKEKWDDAIKCYTRAIEYDNKNAIYYANRSLCFLKLKKFKQAEVDSTIAIQLDKRYVKAYQRRALARIALGQLKEAKSDYEEILVIEPKNSLALFEKSKIEKKLAQDEEALKTKAKAPSFNPKNIFESKKSTLSASKSEPNVNKKLVEEIKMTEKKKEGVLIEEIVEDVKEKVKEKIFKSELSDGCKLIFPVKKPPHKRSKKPLRRIDVVETSDSLPKKDESPVTIERIPVKEELPKKDESPVTIEKIPLKEVVVERANENISKYIDDKVLETPRTSVQFQKAWKFVKTDPEIAYSYLKQIYKQNLAKLFGESLESDLFSEILLNLADDTTQKDPDILYFYLQGLSTVKRFGSLVMFMSAKDKEAVKKLISTLEKSRTEEELKKLRALYEL